MQNTQAFTKSYQRVGRAVLNFSYTCERHQILFIETAGKAGITRPELLDLLRKRMLTWLSNTYPRMVLDHYARASCIACDLEAAGIGDGKHGFDFAMPAGLALAPRAVSRTRHRFPC